VLHNSKSNTQKSFKSAKNILAYLFDIQIFFACGTSATESQRQQNTPNFGRFTPLDAQKQR